MSEAWLLLETSTREGQVGLVIGDNGMSVVRLDPARRQNRDLVPTAQKLLSDNGLSAKELTGVMVSHGPGSFTGLRVGIMSAKVLAYAAGCQLIAVPTFAMLAARIVDSSSVLVVGDALRGHLYVQSFVEGVAQSSMELQTVDSVLNQPSATVTGPGLVTYEHQLDNRFAIAERHLWEPDLAALYRLGASMSPLNQDQLFALEPLYIRASSAEEKAAGVE